MPTASGVQVRLLRPLLVGLALIGAGVGAWFAARDTSVFAVRTIAVEGAPPAIAAKVKDQLAPILGTSLVRFDRAAAASALASLPELSRATFDRAFPHTLRVVVGLETPVAVLRRGSEAWLAAASGRVLRQLQKPYPPLARIWLPRGTSVTVNASVTGDSSTALAALAALREIHLPATVRSAAAGAGGIVLVLANRRQIRLGSAELLRIKLAIAGRILPQVPNAFYVDVSVPERPVVADQPKVSG